MDQTLKLHLANAVACPARECSRGSSCARIVEPTWATLLGWGNPKAPIAFVGLNPHLSDGGRLAHAVPSGTDVNQHIFRLATEGFSDVPHFRYHRRILRTLREMDPVLAEELSDELDLFAFFTEMALCPTEKGVDLPSDVVDRCFDQNVGPFLAEAKFRFVVALGYEASYQAVRKLVSPSAASTIGSGFHGRMFGGGTTPFVITSYHSNARGTWNRNAVAERLFEASRRSGIPLW